MNLTSTGYPPNHVSPVSYIELTARGPGTGLAFISPNVMWLFSGSPTEVKRKPQVLRVLCLVGHCIPTNHVSSMSSIAHSTDSKGSRYMIGLLFPPLSPVEVNFIYCRFDAQPLLDTHPNMCSECPP